MSEKRDPAAAARADVQPKRIRRFYERAEVRPAEGGFELALDGRPAKTPGRNRLASSDRALMERVAAEWRAQGEALDPASMPLTRLLNAALDGVARTMDETRAEAARYAGCDLLCYRADGPEALAERQRVSFDPVLDWAAETLGARFALVAGVMPVAQPGEAVAAVASALDGISDPLALAAVSAMTSLTGSVLLALAVARGRLTPEAAWQAAHIDEDFQAELWGADEEAASRREARWREMEAAGLAVQAGRGG